MDFTEFRTSAIERFKIDRDPKKLVELIRSSELNQKEMEFVVGLVEQNVPPAPKGPKPKSEKVLKAGLIRFWIENEEKTRRARLALKSEAALVANATKGARCATLNSAAFKLGNKVAVGYLLDADVETTLMGAAQRSGLVQDEGHDAVLATIKIGLSAGWSEPESKNDGDPIIQDSILREIEIAIYRPDPQAPTPERPKTQTRNYLNQLDNPSTKGEQLVAAFFQATLMDRRSIVATANQELIRQCREMDCAPISN